MITHTDVQIINNRLGLPEFAVLPYSEYLKLVNKKEINTENVVPSNVVDMVFIKGYSPTKAWRIHLGLSQEEVAEK